MKKTNCPLCGAKSAIIFYSKQPSEPCVISKVRTGNIDLDVHGRGYDLSHAEVCPELKLAFHKKELLEFYVSGQPFMPMWDNLSFEEYQKIVKQKNLTLKGGLDRIAGGSGDMIWRPYVCISSPAFDHLLTYGEDGKEAFSLLKHRLRCGDIIDTGRSKLQLVEKGDSLELETI